MDPRLAIIETSHRSGWVALALGGRLLGARPLHEARRHTRDLAPMLRELLNEQGWKAADLEGVIVSRGPGSYTGLRVGLMSARTLAYATGCRLLAIETFAAIARQLPAELREADIIADAQQDRIYVQRYCRGSPSNDLRILSLSEWLATRGGQVMVAGPGLEIFAERLPAEILLASQYWLPRPESLLQVGLQRFQRGERDDPFTVEPLYLRPSSAEEKFENRTHGQEEQKTG